MDASANTIEGFVRGLLDRHDSDVLLEMEREAQDRGFPIVGRSVGVVLEILARSIAARRVMELGSGFGYSAYWFSRAVGPDGEVHLTDGDPANEPKALDYLGRAGLDGPVRFHVGDALDAMAGLPGEFDVVFCDIDKGDYPRAWEAARRRVRVGGLYVCDNALGFGAGNVLEYPDGRAGAWLDAIREHDGAALSDQDHLATILPIRDGVLVALRLK
ncbi:MAG TPA: O-methyltransferase [Actinomycetota bacterium]|nr:O-methyltransferase [Actinomycetota bacterium]